MRHQGKAILAALLATTVSTGVYAQSVSSDTSAGADVGASVSTGSTEMNANTGVSGSADVSGDASGATDLANDAMDGAKDTANGVKSQASQMASDTSDMAKENYGQLIANLRSGATAKMDAETFANVGEDTTVNTVLVSDLKGEADANAQSLDKALDAQEDQIADLRDAIGSNTTLKQALDAKGYTADDVVAVETSGSDSVTLVIDDRS